MGEYPGEKKEKTYQMKRNRQRKIPFSLPLSVCLLVLHVVVAPQRFFSAPPPYCRQETS